MWTGRKEEGRFNLCYKIENDKLYQPEEFTLNGVIVPWKCVKWIWDYDKMTKSENLRHGCCVIDYSDMIDHPPSAHAGARDQVQLRHEDQAVWQMGPVTNHFQVI